MPTATAAPIDPLDTLTEINVDDLLDAAGLSALRHAPPRAALPHAPLRDPLHRLLHRPLRRLLHRALRAPARRFAALAHGFDQRVGTHGLAAGSAWLLQRTTAGLDVSGANRVPASGPLLLLANHPGMTDTIALLSALALRPDLRVIAADRPFLRALPHVARSLILLPAGGGGHVAVLRAAVAHLKRGGALLSFPAGRIEPDPAGAGPRPAMHSLHAWSDSTALLARRVPQTQWLVALVSNVVSADAQRHPLTWLRRRAADKEKLAAALQVALPRYQRLTARVTFGAPQPVSGDAAALHAAMLAQARRLIDELPAAGANAVQPQILAARDTRPLAGR